MSSGFFLPLSGAARRVAKLGACAVLASWLPSPAMAEGTPAGSILRNTATATYESPSGGETTVTSNEVALTVDEILGATVVSGDPGDVPVTPGATAQILRFTLTNVGNGSEAFSLLARSNAGGDDFDPSTAEIVLDSNGNGAYDAGVDTLYVAGSNDPVLAPDAALTLFVRSAIPAGVTDGQRARVDLVATAGTGSGAPGTVFAGQGQGGASCGEGKAAVHGVDPEAEGGTAAVAVAGADCLTQCGGRSFPAHGLDVHAAQVARQRERAVLHRGLQLHAAFGHGRQRGRHFGWQAPDLQPVQPGQLVLDALPPHVGGRAEGVDDHRVGLAGILERRRPGTGQVAGGRRQPGVNRHPG